MEIRKYKYCRSFAKRRVRVENNPTLTASITKKPLDFGSKKKENSPKP
jgi:hypothetical protein